MSDFTTKVGNNIRFYREKKRMTLRELGGKIGITEATVQKYEAGSIKRVDAEMIKKIADALSIAPATLTGWDEEDKGEPEKSAILKATKEASLLKRYGQLNEENKLTVSKLIDFLASTQE